MTTTMTQARQWDRHTVREMIQANYETEEPDRIRQMLTVAHGKPITTRLLKLMPGGAERWRLRRQYGMTHLEERRYWGPNRNDGDPYPLSFLLAHSERAAPFDIDQFVDLNPAYFRGRVERNHQRMEALNTRETLDGLATAMNAVHEARRALALARADLDEWIGYGAPAHADQREIQKACDPEEPTS